MPQLGVEAAAQTAGGCDFAECGDLQLRGCSSRLPSPGMLVEGKEQARSFWDGLLEEV